MKRSKFLPPIVICTVAALMLCFVHDSSRYALDKSKSTVKWTGYYLFNFGEHYGSIDLSNGELVVTNEEITGGFFEIDMTSIRDLDMPENDGGKDLSDHLKGDDFFATGKFPQSRFDITKSEKIADARPGESNFDITGNLTIKDVTKSIKFPAIVTVKNNIVEAKAKFKFDRTRWGIQYNSGKIFSDVGDGAISDAIALDVTLVTTLNKN